MALHNKTFAGYAAVVSVMVAVIVWAVLNMSSLGDAIHSVLRENYRSIEAARKMDEAVSLQDRLQTDSLLKGKALDWAAFHDGEQRFFLWLGRARDNITIEGEGDVLDAIDIEYRKYLSESRNFAGAGHMQGGRSPADGGALRGAVDAVRKLCADLRELNETTMFSASGRASALARRAVWSTGGVATLALLALVLLAVLFRRLRQAAHLEELEHLKRDFVMTASHELRTPLSALAMSIDLLVEQTSEDAEEGHREMLSVAQQEVRRLRALVDDLLDLSRMEAGKIQMDFASVRVDLLFDKARAIFGPQSEKLSVELDAFVPEDFPEIHADANKILWVLSNLISNSLRYVKPGGHVRLTVERVGQRACISVSDDGVGIPEAFQSRIFDKFVKLDGEHGGGSGLGLAICKEIVRAHKGSIWVASTPGTGSTFTFALPLRR